MLTDAAAGVGDKEGRIRRRCSNKAELNQKHNRNRTLDQNQDQDPDQISMDLPSILISNPYCHHHRFL